MSNVPAILTIIGGLMLLIALLGGGLSIKEVSIPVVPNHTRVILLPVGLVFLALGVWLFLPESSRPELGSPSARSTASTAAPAQAEPARAEPATPVPSGPVVVEWLYRFEEPDNLWFNPDDRGSTMDCVRDSDQIHAGSWSARMDLELVAGGWGDCWVEDPAVRDWSHADGVSFWVRTDHADTRLIAWIQNGTVDHRWPFEASFPLPAEALNAWTRITLPWSRFALADYAEPGSPSTFSPSDVVLMGYSVHVETAAAGVSVWIDDVALVTE